MNRRKTWQGNASRLVAESVTTTTARPVEVRETTGEAARPARVDPTGARMTVHYIRAGWSLNNRYWPAEILRTEGVAAAVPGTQLYIDHATDREDDERPAGSMLRLAAVQDGPAWWDEAAQAIAANVIVFRPWREMLLDSKDAAGLSVRAWVTSRHGDIAGQSGEIVESFEGLRSVDFVTIPAAGGRIVSVLESVDARRAEEARNAGAWFESLIHSDFTVRADQMYGNGYLTRDERITLSNAIGAALAAFTATIEEKAPQLFTRDPYREPEAATEPADESAASSQEGTTMTTPNTGPAAAAPADTGIAPAAEAVTANARAAVAEAENERLTSVLAQNAESQRVAAEAVARAERAEADARTMRANEAGRIEVARQIAALGAQVPASVAGLIAPRVEAAVYGRVPLVAEGVNAGHADEAGLTAAVTSAIEAERLYAARILEAYGVGTPSDLGGISGSAGDGGVSNEDLDKILLSNWAEQGMPEAARNIAVKGR